VRSLRLNCKRHLCSSVPVGQPIQETEEAESPKPRAT
jgi:hypothetical protein